MNSNLRLTLLVFVCAAGVVVATPQSSKAQCCGSYSSYYVPYVSWYWPTTACYGGCGSSCGSCGSCSSCSTCSAGCGSTCGGCSSCGSGCGSCGYRACYGGCGSCYTSYYYPTYYGTWWPWFGARETTSQLARSTAPTSRMRLTSSGTASVIPSVTASITARRRTASREAKKTLSVVPAAARPPEPSEQGPQLLLISQPSDERARNDGGWKTSVPSERASKSIQSPGPRAVKPNVSLKSAENQVFQISGEGQMLY
jgi:hypothetical protein